MMINIQASVSRERMKRLFRETVRQELFGSMIEEAEVSTGEVKKKRQKVNPIDKKDYTTFFMVERLH
jgi:hypothetical protein